jgi:hypothetical protein
MKIRNGFVSNSSSASFVVYKDKITPLQYKAIMSHDIYAAKVLKWDCSWSDDGTFTYDRWDNIKETEKTLKGSTLMDNFEMDKFFIEIGLSPDAYEFESSNG